MGLFEDLREHNGAFGGLTGLLGGLLFGLFMVCS